MTRIPAETRQQAMELWNQGLPCKEIAAKTGLAPSTLTRFFDREGISREERSQRRSVALHRVNRDKAASLVRRYEDGEAPRQMAAELGVSVATVRNVLREAGAKMLGRGAAGGHNRIRWTDDELKHINDRYESGFSQNDVAEEMGCAQWVISEALFKFRGERVRRRPHATEPVVLKNGYVLVWIEADHPFASMRLSNGYIGQHRLVMAEHLGRPLKRTETVHHIDLDHSNNALSNLQLRQGKHGKGGVFQCADCGSLNVMPIPLPD